MCHLLWPFYNHLNFLIFTFSISEAQRTSSSTRSIVFQLFYSKWYWNSNKLIVLSDVLGRNPHTTYLAKKINDFKTRWDFREKFYVVLKNQNFYRIELIGLQKNVLESIPWRLSTESTNELKIIYLFEWIVWMRIIIFKFDICCWTSW